MSRKQQQAEAAKLASKIKTLPTPRSSPFSHNLPPQAISAAATAMKISKERLVFNNENWQEQAWQYHRTLGEFRYGVEWLSDSISRVRLRAAKIHPGQDEPEIVDSGLAAELVSELRHDVGGRSSLLKRMTELWSVVGEGYLIGEEKLGEQVWEMRSKDEIRQRSGHIEIIDDDHSTAGNIEWRPLSPESMFGRIWSPNARYKYLADSPAHAALPVMYELELVNRKIQAQYLSRLASAGIVIFPEGLTFPVREEFQDAPDPFIREWIEAAKEAIKEPGTAASVIPIPIRVPDEFVGKIQFIDFTLMLDDKIIEKRDSIIKRLATVLDMPAEVLLGLGGVTHWNAWQIDEGGIKLHIAPVIEALCHGLTSIYLAPRLKAAGEDSQKWVMWYDASELVLRPDKTTNATNAYDRLEISGRALRRETGFGEDDKPNNEELLDQVLKFVARNPRTGDAVIPVILNELVGTNLPTVPDSTDQKGGGEPGELEKPKEGDSGKELPPSKEKTPERKTTPPEKKARVEKREYFPVPPMTMEMVKEHLVSIDLGNKWSVLHPSTCENKFLCPITWRVYLLRNIAPGTHGKYKLDLSPNKELIFGERVLSETSLTATQVK